MKITIATALLAMSTLFAQSTATPAKPATPATPAAPASGKMGKTNNGKHKGNHKKIATTPAPPVK